MNQDYFRKINVAELYRPFSVLVQKLVENCRFRGVEYWATSGYRSVEEQDRLYAQGRTTPGEIVTKARGGQSNHNFSVACDLTFDKDIARDGLQPDWQVQEYKVLAEEAQKLGLEAGYYWKFQDAPHVQLPLEKAGIKLADLQSAYKNGGMNAVRNLLDKHRW
jgi:peptidoglycan L-alanyl-D-glutamate endopeptidase CwlK